MARQRVIVGIGEAVLCDFPDRTEPGGLAISIARHATRFGHHGIAVSRVGQDAWADELQRQMRALGLTLDHMQTDPDWPTGRLVVRSVAGRTTTSLTPRAAFDNLQWDFDLVDVAQQADAVVFGHLARREGQSRSIIKRFLAECRSAVRLFDLTNRSDDALDRGEVLSALEYAEGIIVDGPAMRRLTPAVPSDQPQAAMRELFRQSRLAFAAITMRDGATERLMIINGDSAVAESAPYPAAQHDAATVGLLHGLLAGRDLSQCAALATRAAEAVAADPDAARSALDE